MNKGTLIIAPAPGGAYGSLGDAAMVEVAYERAALGGRIAAFHPRALDSEWPDKEIFFWDLSSPYFVQVVSSLFDAVWCIGADVLDGAYNDSAATELLPQLQQLAALGVTVRILGFSIRSNPCKNAIRALAKLADLAGAGAICAREPVTRSRLELHDIACKQVADVAFLLPKRGGKSVEAFLGWADQHRRASRSIVAFCYNEDMFQTEVAREFASSVVLSLLRNDCAVIVLAHDFRGGDFQGSIEALSAVHKQFGARLTVLSPPFSPGAAKQVASMCDTAISMRMHFTVACLSEGIPVLSVEYQDKFEGLYELFSFESAWKEAMRIPGLPIGTADLTGRLDFIRTNAQAIREHIKSHLPTVTELAERNF